MRRRRLWAFAFCPCRQRACGCEQAWTEPHDDEVPRPSHLLAHAPHGVGCQVRAVLLPPAKLRSDAKTHAVAMLFFFLSLSLRPLLLSPSFCPCPCPCVFAVCGAEDGPLCVQSNFFSFSSSAALRENAAVCACVRVCVGTGRSRELFLSTLFCVLLRVAAFTAANGSGSHPPSSIPTPACSVLRVIFVVLLSFAAACALCRCDSRDDAGHKYDGKKRTPCPLRPAPCPLSPFTSCRCFVARFLCRSLTDALPRKRMKQSPDTEE